MSILNTFTDIHAHLFDCDDDSLAKIVSDARAVGVSMIVNTAVSVETARTVIDQCKHFPNNMRAAIGISPFDTIDADDNRADELTTIITEQREAVIAIGEIGLDCTNPKYPPLTAQMPFFIKQLEIAKDANLPAVIHSRGMEKRTAEICRDTGVSRAIFHCFTGDTEAMEYIVSNGYYISISGIITYKNSHLQDLIRYMPLDKLLIETDTPYLSPVPHRGKPNAPSNLIHTANSAANVLGLDTGELSYMLKENTAKAFGMEHAPHAKV